MTRARGRGKWRRYSGRLSTPLKLNQQSLYPGRLGASLKHDAPSLDFGEWLDRISELCREFKINQSQPGWEADLALSLAYRHENLVREGRVHYAELFERYGINRTSDGAEYRLALEIAHKHVPGLTPALPRNEMTDEEGVGAGALIVAIVMIRNHLQTPGTGRKDGAAARAGVPVRAIARILLGKHRGDEPELRQILGEDWTTCVTKFLSSRGNRDRTSVRTISDKSLREHIRSVLLGAADSGRRKLTPRRDFVPTLLGGRPGRTGQN